MSSFSAAAAVDRSLRNRQHRGWDLHPYPPVSRRRRDQRLHHRLRGERDHPEQGDLLAVLVVLLHPVSGRLVQPAPAPCDSIERSCTA